MKDDAIVNINNVGFRYQHEPVLENINLTIKWGDFLGLVGPNGSGKTTLLKIIVGLIKPDSGSVELFGQSQSRFTDWAKIGYVPQKAALSNPTFPVTVAEAVGMNGGDPETIRRALAGVAMENKMTQPLNELSGGQQQRVFIARALVSRPQLLILDEPTVGVDIDSQLQFYRLLKNLNQKHALTLVLVSHDIDVVAHETKTVACINKTLICHGEPHTVLRGDFLDQLYGRPVRLLMHNH
ncbi:metal ABC transporter ATP-binding protein [Patescibacteria group bacterium]|nr:metal ABC transporter ATP-binding protein [Patescibacteria group bacterium]